VLPGQAQSSGLFGRILIFLLKLPRQECPGVTGGDVLSVEPAHDLHLLADLRESARRQWDRAIFLAFTVVDGEQHGIKVEALNPEVDALGEAQSAAIEQETDQAVGRLQLTEDGFRLGTGEDNRNIPMTFGANHAIEFAKFAPQHVAVKEQQGVESPILCGCGYPISHRQL